MIFDRLRTLTGTMGGQSGLLAAASDYPPYKPPHRTGGDFIGMDRLKENLADFLEHRSERLDRISTLVRTHGLEPLSALTLDADPLPFLDALDACITENWRGGHISRKHLSREFWIRHCDDGSTNLYGFLADLGLLLGEILIAQRPCCRWGFDAMARKRDNSSYVNRTLVVGLAVPADVTIPSFYDPALSAFHALRTVRYHPQPGMHDLTWSIRARLSFYPALEPVGDRQVLDTPEHV